MSFASPHFSLSVTLFLDLSYDCSGLGLSLFSFSLSATYDDTGNEKKKEVLVKMTNLKTNQVWVWSRAKFINRKYLIEELYNQIICEGEWFPGVIPCFREMHASFCQPMKQTQGHNVVADK